jgi:hypothetical protein
MEVVMRILFGSAISLTGYALPRKPLQQRHAEAGSVNTIVTPCVNRFGVHREHLTVFLQKRSTPPLL